MSDDSTKPAEVTPEAAAVVAAVKTEAQAWLEKSEQFVTIGGGQFAVWELDEAVCDDSPKVRLCQRRRCVCGVESDECGEGGGGVWDAGSAEVVCSGVWVGDGWLGDRCGGCGGVTLPKRVLSPVPEMQAIKGLRSFEGKDAEIFKRLERGRDVQDCLDALNTPDLRLFLLMGESGVGKSSLLQAGLMPNLGQVGLAGVYVKLGDRNPNRASNRFMIIQV